MMEHDAIADGRFGDGRLRQFADSLWTAATPIRFAGTWFPHVMTVICLATDGVVLHSPCRPSSGLLEDVARLGPVTHVIAPNWFHDLYLREYRASYPAARFWGPRFLRQRQSALIDAVLDSHVCAPWTGELQCTSLSGLLSFDETVFFHVATRTLLVADLLTNAVADDRAPLFTRLGYRLFGLDGRLKVFPLLRRLGLSSRASLRLVASQIVAWNPDRLIVGHGHPIEGGVMSQLRSTLELVR